jgi:hypothetical protein
MSQVLYALVILQGTSGLAFEPGYTSATECIQQYKGPFVACFAYDPSLSTWTAFFKLPEGGFRTVGKIASEDECKRYIGAFKDGIPTACRQLAMPVTCNVACVAPVPAPPPAAKPVEPDPKPDPASIDTKPSVPQALPEHIQVGGKQYTKVAGLTSVEREATKPDSFADVSVGPNDLQSKDQPSPLPPKTAEAPKAPKRVVVAQGPHYYDRAPQPMQALIDTVMLPFDFLSYPGRRDW